MLVVALLSACFAPAGAASAYDRSSATRQPLNVLVEANPWLMVVGSDSPTFALYDDGLAIWRTDDGYHSGTLSDEGVSSLMARVDAEALNGLNSQGSSAAIKLAVGLMVRT